MAEPKPAYERVAEPKLSPTSVAPLDGGLEPKCSPDILDMDRASRKMNASNLSFDIGTQEAINPNLAHRFVKGASSSSFVNHPRWPRAKKSRWMRSSFVKHPQYPAPASLTFGLTASLPPLQRSSALPPSHWPFPA